MQLQTWEDWIGNLDIDVALVSCIVIYAPSPRPLINKFVIIESFTCEKGGSNMTQEKYFHYYYSKPQVYLQGVLGLVIIIIMLGMFSQLSQTQSMYGNDNSSSVLLLIPLFAFILAIFFIINFTQKQTEDGLILAGDPHGLTLRYMGNQFHKLAWNELNSLTYAWREYENNRSDYLSIEDRDGQTYRVNLETIVDQLNNIVQDIQVYRPDLQLKVQRMGMFDIG